MSTVRWTQNALDELAVIWTTKDADLRKRITAAANQIDKELRDRPEDKGESRPDGQRIFVVFPIGVFFRVAAKTQDVEVTRVWLIRPGKKKGFSTNFAGSPGVRYSEPLGSQGFGVPHPWACCKINKLGGEPKKA